MKHVQGSGLRKGQWVECDAQVMCRLQGTHAAGKTVEYAAEYFQDKGELKGKKPTEEQVKEFLEKFSSSPIRYRLSKIPKEELDVMEVTFPALIKRNRRTGEETETRGDSYIKPYLQALKLAYKKDVLILISSGGSNKEVRATPEFIEEQIRTYKNSTASKFNDLDKLSFVGRREDVAYVVENYHKAIQRERY